MSFFNFFFDNKKPTFTGKSAEISEISEIFRKAAMLFASVFFEFSRTLSNVPNPLIISLRPKV